MSKRREFGKPVRVQIVKRASDAKGVTRCEECHTVVRQFEIHHVIPDAMEIDKSLALKPEDGILLCVPCHAEHTHKHDVPAIAKAKRNEARHIGVVGKPTQLSGRTRAEVNADKATRAAARGAKPSLPPRSLFVSAGDGR